MRACSTTRFPSEFHPSRRSFRPHLARRCTRVLVEHIAEHHLTKKREKTRILTTTTTAKQILPRPPKRDSNRAPRWRPSYFAPSLSREKKNNDAPSFLFFFASKRQRTLPQHNFVERERDFNKRRTKRPEKFKDSNLFSNTLNSKKEKNWSSVLSSLVFFSEKARRSFAEV